MVIFIVRFINLGPDFWRLYGYNLKMGCIFLWFLNIEMRWSGVAVFVAICNRTTPHHLPWPEERGSSQGL